MITQLHEIAHPQCSACQIRERAICSRCDDDELQMLEKIKYYRSFSAGDAIVWRGDSTDFLGSVVSGTATLGHTMKDGRRQMVGLLQPSDFIGRPGRALAPYDVTAITDLVLCCFQRAPFERLVESTPHISRRLLEMTLDELDVARQWMLLLGRKTAREKIASLFIMLATRAATLGGKELSGQVTFDLPLTREVMADCMGLTLETVSRQISALRREGLVVLAGSRQITLPDFEMLAAESGDDDENEALA